MTWINDRGIQRWEGEFVEPSDTELIPYVVHIGNRDVVAEKHGTPGGARRHKRRGETPCEACSAGQHREQKRSRERERDNRCVDCGALILRTSVRCQPCAITYQAKEAS